MFSINVLTNKSILTTTYETYDGFATPVKVCNSH